MIKGALIFAAGVGVGYSAAMANQEPNGDVKRATEEFLKTMKSVMADAWLDTKNEMAVSKMEEVAKDAKYCPYCGASEESDGHGKAHADDCPIVTKKSQGGDASETIEAEPQGETPS